jgi:hypothetical protein
METDVVADAMWSMPAASIFSSADRISDAVPRTRTAEPL